MGEGSPTGEAASARYQPLAPGARGEGRFAEMDVLRGIMALLVLLFHYTDRFQVSYGFATPPTVRVTHGEIFVLVFFSLSGYFIMMLASRVQSIPDYVVSRASRLYPAYWVAMLLTFAAASVFGLPGREVSWRALLANATMIQEYLNQPHVDGAYWSLNVEVTFYGWILLVLACKGVRRMPRLLWVGIGLSCLFVLAEHWGYTLPWRVRHALLVETIPFFALGMGFYLLSQTGDRRLYALLVFAMLAGIFVRKSPSERLTAPLIFLALFLAVHGRLRWLVHPTTVFLGTVSYPLYLVHQNIGYIVLRSALHHGFGTMTSLLFATTVAFALATLITMAVEQPAMAAIRGWWKRRSTQDDQPPRHIAPVAAAQ